MKNTFTLLIMLTIWVNLNASELFLLKTGTLQQTKEIFQSDGVIIHFYNDDFVIGTSERTITGSVILENDPWSDPGKHYFILFTHPATPADFFTSVRNHARILHQEDQYLVVETGAESACKLEPAVHGGIVKISNKPARFPSKSFHYKPGTLSPRDEISDMIALVNQDTLESYVQQLQDFGTRNAYKAGGIAAQNWILAKFQSFGLDAELHDFTMPSGPASDNVIATLPGTVYPDEYVILGAHYDSYAGGNNEPGADDNATGTAGILEAARIMSQYTFDRTIIFAAWSGEEYGLYGSDAWATEAAESEMIILGYFNIDMAGYLEPGDEIHTDIIAPASANELRQFYKDVCAIYLPGFGTFDGILAGGDSDHTSFNNNGFQGIFPFEDSQNYSPYIHTANDLIGPSVNNFEQHMTFVQATMANVATMTSQLPTPENLTAMAGDQQVDLAWNAVEGAGTYHIYRNSLPDPYATVTLPTYTDTGVENGNPYTYYVTAVFEDSGEESGPSNPVTAIPMPPIALPFFDDFETGAPFWITEDTWGLQEGIYHSSTFALTESPNGNYDANMDASVKLRSLDFTNAETALVSFWTRFNIESGYDFMYFEVSAGGTDWEILDSFTGVQNTWIQKSYSLDDYKGLPAVTLRFRFTSDVYIEAQGMFIDDFEVNINGVGIDVPEIEKNVSLRFSPNPTNGLVVLEYQTNESNWVKIDLVDASGKMVKPVTKLWKQAGPASIDLNIENLGPGVYYGVMESGNIRITEKLVITK